MSDHGQRESDRALSFLARLATEIAVVLNLSTLLDTITRSLHEEIGFDSAAISIVEQHAEQQVLVVRAASGLRADARGLVFPQGSGLVWEIVKTNRPERIVDLHKDPRLLRRDPGVRSGIYAPLATDGRALGVLSAYRALPDGFTQGDLDLLTVLARYLGAAVRVSELHEQLQLAAQTDPLTGLANRRALHARVDSELRRSALSRRSLSLVWVDLDGFKAINDQYGHLVGDQVLTGIGAMLKAHVRHADLVTRYGGDEFVVLLVDTDAAAAAAAVDRLGSSPIALAEIARSAMFPGNPQLGFCLGTASWPEDGDTTEQLIQVADRRLYEKKRRRDMQVALKEHATALPQDEGNGTVAADRRDRPMRSDRTRAKSTR